MSLCMIAFETRAGKNIDIDTVEEVMLGKYTEPRFLDVVTGSVEGEEGMTREEIPVLPKERLEKEMRSFIEVVIVGEGEENGEEIVAHLTKLPSQKNVYAGAMQILETDEAWMIGWREWISTSAWEELRAWLLSADSGIVEVATFDCSCPLCHDMAESLKHNKRMRIDWNFENMREEGDKRV